MLMRWRRLRATSYSITVVTPRGAHPTAGAGRPAADRVRDHHHAGVEPARRVLCAGSAERDEPPRGADRAWAGHAGATRTGSRRDPVRPRAQHRAGRLLHPHVSAELIDGLRGHAGRSVFEPGNPAMGLILRHSPHRVFVTRAGRAEVYQAIPAHGGVSPEGPHTHVLPKLLAHGRTHAATEPIPAGWVSCAHSYPAHPLRDGYGRAIPFDAARHQRFQSLLRQFGDPAHVGLKDQIAAALASGEKPSAIARP